MLITLVSYCAFLILLFSIPVRRRAAFLRAGSSIYSLKNKKSVLIKSILILLLCGLLVFVDYLRVFSVFVDIAICGTAILGAELTVRELCLYKMNGIYQNCIILGSDFVVYDDIMGLPVLQLPEEEQKKYQKNILYLVTKSKGNQQLIFDSDDDCKKAMEIILKDKPELR